MSCVDCIKYGETLAMIWIKNDKTEPPEWMRHDPTIQNKYGYTLAILWIDRVRTEPPEWMK